MNGRSGILSILSNALSNDHAFKIIMNEVKAISNKCYYYKGSTVYIACTGYADITLHPMDVISLIIHLSVVLLYILIILAVMITQMMNHLQLHLYTVCLIKT